MSEENNHSAFVGRRGTYIKKEDFPSETLKKVSTARRAEIMASLQKGAIHKYGDEASPVVGIGVKKVGFSTVGAPASITRTLPEIYSPLFQVANLNLPRDRMTMNAWNRIFFNTHPIVKNAITLHSTYPISKINIKCKDRKVEQFFNDMAEKIDLFKIIAEVAHEFWVNGEAFPYAELDENLGMWSRINVQNPDYVVVKKSGFSDAPVISIRADETLKKIVSSNHPSDVKLRSQIPNNIIHHIKKNEPIPVDNFNISHLKLLSSPYDVRGISIIVSCYKALMWWDKLIECELAQADELINPITLISVGGSGEGEAHLGDRDLEAYREVFEHAQSDKNYKIITHAALKVERVGASGAVIDTSNKFNLIRDLLYAGLMVPKAVMDQEGAAYASASVGLEVLRTRYVTFRNMLEKWLEKKIFAPISRIQGFFKFSDKEKQLIVPQVDWNHINLYDLNDYIQAIGQQVDKGKISTHTLYRSLGLNWEEEQRLIREETIRNVILTKEAAQFQRMTLSELRALSPDAQVIEDMDKEEPVPGEAPATGMEGLGAELSMPLTESGIPGTPPIAPPTTEMPPAPAAPAAPPTEAPKK